MSSKTVEKPKPLVRRNAEQWKILRSDIDALLCRFEKDENELIARARAAIPDGFPAGGEGSRSSDVTDSTLSAVLAREGVETHDPAVRAIRTLNKALGLLDDAEKHRVEAFPPPPKLVEPAGWCASCLKINWHSPVDTARYAKTNLNCSWCSALIREQREKGRPGFTIPVWMLRKHARSERIYDIDIVRAEREFDDAYDRAHAQAARL